MGVRIEYDDVMEPAPANPVTLHATCAKLNQLYHDLAEGEWLAKGDPFIVTDYGNGDQCIAIEPQRDREWEVFVVLGKVLAGELPRGKSSYRKPYDTQLIG